MARIFRYGGFGEESVFNTPAAAAFHQDILSSSLDTPDEPSIVIEGGLGRAARYLKAGYYAPSGNVVFPADAQNLLYFLRWALGQYEWVEGGGATPPHSHYMWAGDGLILPSFTSRIGKDQFEHVFGGCTINGLQIEISDGLVQVTPDIIAAEDSKAHPDEIEDFGDLTLTSLSPLAFHEATMSSGPTSKDVHSLTINIANNVDDSAGRGLGSRHPQRLPAGEREVTAEMELWFDDTDELRSFWGGNTGPSGEQSTWELEVVLEDPDGNKVTITLPDCRHQAVNLQPSGRDRLVQSVSARAFDGKATGLSTPLPEKADIVALVESDAADLDA